MALALMIHLASVLLLGMACDVVYGRYVRRDNVSEKTAIWLGLGLGVMRVVWILAPWISPLPPLRIRLTGALRLGEYWLGWALLAAILGLAIWGVARVWGSLKLLAVFEQENLLVDHGMESADYFMHQGVRRHLEDEYRSYTGLDLVVRLSWLTELPLLVGVKRPLLVVPMGLVQSGKDVHLEPMLDQQAEHLRMRHHWLYQPMAWAARLVPPMTSLAGSVGRAMLTQVDRRVFQQGDEKWQRHEEALSMAVQDREEWSPAVALPHHAQEAAQRVQQARSTPQNRRQAGMITLLVALFLGGLGLSASVGRVSLHSMKEFLMHHEVSGFQTRIFDPKVHLVGLPGQGGILPDGVVVDAMSGSSDFEVTSLQAHLRRQLPDVDEAVLSFDYRSEKAAGRVDAEDAPMATSRTTEYRFTQDRGLHEFRTFDFRAVPMPEGSGTIDLKIRLKDTTRTMAGSIDRHYGPDLAIPAGWRVEVRNFRVRAAGVGEVTPTKFPEDADPFVAWYQRHERGTAINLRW